MKSTNFIRFRFFLLTSQASGEINALSVDVCTFHKNLELVFLFCPNFLVRFPAGPLPTDETLEQGRKVSGWLASLLCLLYLREFTLLCVFCHLSNEPFCAFSIFLDSFFFFNILLSFNLFLYKTSATAHALSCQSG